VQLLSQAEHLTLERTGHIGIVTRPALFADIVAEFVGRTKATARAIQQKAG
jgi:hypothetical protein